MGEKEMSEMNNDSPNTPLNQQDDDEWDDYRENKKDYTGLKIENLTAEQPKEEEEEETEVNEDGEVVLKARKDESGPWNKLGGEGGSSELGGREGERRTQTGEGKCGAPGSE